MRSREDDDVRKENNLTGEAHLEAGASGLVCALGCASEKAEQAGPRRRRDGPRVKDFSPKLFRD